MKKATKVLALLLCAALLVGASIMGTLAYLTSAKTVENTFTVGNVEIKLDEAKVDDDGKAITPEVRHAEGNAYHLLPNLSYDKDPTVWVREGSERAYIRMIVTVSNYDQMLLAFSDEDAAYDDTYIVTSAPGVAVSGSMVVLDNLVDRNSGAWQCVRFDQDEAAKTGTYEFRYFPGAYTASEDDKDGVEEFDALPALLTTITVPKDIDNVHLACLNNTKITVTAQAIQAAGFHSVEEAWANFPG